MVLGTIVIENAFLICIHKTIVAGSPITVFAVGFNDAFLYEFFTYLVPGQGVFFIVRITSFHPLIPSCLMVQTHKTVPIPHQPITIIITLIETLHIHHIIVVRALIPRRSGDAITFENARGGSTLEIIAFLVNSLGATFKDRIALGPLRNIAQATV